MNLSNNEIRRKFLDFFRNREHAILDSASLVTSDKKSVTDSTLFNTAGVQPLVPYLLGEKHPEGERLASSQKCIRTIDIEEVGDKTHLTFFEMLGNWSLGNYFKAEAIKWSFEFLTSKTEGLGLDPKKIYVTVFAGNNVSEKDIEAFEIWKNYLDESRIYFLESNWWEAGENGPCGPDTEIFYNISENDLGKMSHDEFIKADAEQKVIEIWNNVFMQFFKENGQIQGKLKNYAVDTGAGLERLSVVVNNLSSVYDSKPFKEIIELIETQSKNFTIESARIISDHIKAAYFIISDSVTPSNSGRGYILRRLIRRAVRHSILVGFDVVNFEKIVDQINSEYANAYQVNIENIKEVINIETKKFQQTLNKGVKEIEKIIEKGEEIDAKLIFNIYSTYGFPIELILEILKEKKIVFDINEVKKEIQKHQEKSRTASSGMFKGGLQDTGEMETRLHTTTHILNKALKIVLGDHVKQEGSNINAERLRFDFSHPQKLTDIEKQKIEEIVNDVISKDLSVNYVVLPKEKALNCGAEHVFESKYEKEVKVYYIGNSLDDSFSKEFCGGPHVSKTGELGIFKIQKEESVSAGVRRIKAVLS